MCQHLAAELWHQAAVQMTWYAQQQADVQPFMCRYDIRDSHMEVGRWHLPQIVGKLQLAFEWRNDHFRL